MGVRKINSDHFSKIIGPVLIVALPATTDVYIWHAAISSFVVFIIFLGWAMLRLMLRNAGKFMAVVKVVVIGAAALALSLSLGTIIDSYNERAARILVIRLIEYKTTQGHYPTQEVADKWIKPIIGYKQWYSLTSMNEAYISFEKYNHHIQTMVVNSGKLLKERDI